MSNKNITVRLPEELIERLQAQADREERTLSAQIRLILREYVKSLPVHGEYQQGLQNPKD